MRQYFLDSKLSFLTGTYFAITFTDIDSIMKVIVFLLTVGYTIRRWYIMEKKTKDTNYED